MDTQGLGPPRPGNMTPRSAKQNATIAELLQRFDSIQLLPVTEGKKVRSRTLGLFCISHRGS